jgi:proteasome accessory factor B
MLADIATLPRGQAMERSSPLLRQWVLLKTLSSRRHGATVQELAAEVEVHEKTIRRDLALFLQAGFPLHEQRGPHGRKAWCLKTAAGHTEVSFALDEALALYLGRRFLDPLAGTFLGQAAHQAFQKVRACLGPTALSYLDKMAGNLHATAVGVSDYSQQAELLDLLLQAIEERKAMILLYQPLRATEPVEYEVCPYGLAWHRGSLYLVAHSRDHDEIRHFKVNRISEAEPGRFPFHMPKDFDLASHFAASFGVYQGRGDERVVVRFLPPAARYVQESRWHPSQRLTPQKDGSLLAEFHLSDTEEIRHWILSFGKHARIESPPALVATLRDELQHMTAAYAQSTTP